MAGRIPAFAADRLQKPLSEYSSLAFLAQKGWHFLGMFLIIIWFLWLKRERPHFLKAGIAAGALFALDFRHSSLFSWPSLDLLERLYNGFRKKRMAKNLG